MSISRHIYAITGLIVLLSALSLSSSRAARLASPTQNVNVVNATSNPVPTSAQGTTQVAGTVAVSSLPAVQLGSGATVAITQSGEWNVKVANDASSPLPVQDATASKRT